jgi:serine/threonine protein kinase
MAEPLSDDATLDERYSACWAESGPDQTAAAFLAGHVGAPLTEQLDVLLLDQLLRWRSGSPKRVEEYVAEHPTLTGDPEFRLMLIQGEFRALLERDESPDPATYIAMFPDLAEEIRTQFEIDRWLTSTFPNEPGSVTPTPAETVELTETEAIDQVVPSSGSTIAVSSDLDAPLRDSDFELLRPLGSGGMGEVYEAVQRSLRKHVAIKLMHREALDSPSRVRRFIAEARTLGRLRHPRIVDVHGIGRMGDGRHFLVMDLIEGGSTLAAMIKAGPVSFDRAAAMVASIAETIDHAHKRGVVHRDLKPSNVLLDAEGNPHVTDFGLAKIFDQADPDHPPTTADQILGTPHFMSPEQADPARGPITPRTDVYGLGGILFALLTGKPPIQGHSITQLLTQIVSPQPVRSPRELRTDVPPALERICLKCLEKEPEKRFATAGEVAGSLKTWPADTEGAALEQPSRGREDRPTHGHWAPDPSLKGDRRRPDENRWSPSKSTAGKARRRIVIASVATLLLAMLLVVPNLWRPVRLDRYGPVVGSGFEVAESPVIGRRKPKEMGNLFAPDRPIREASPPGTLEAQSAPVATPVISSDRAPSAARLAVRASRDVLTRFRAGTGSIAIVLDCSGSMLQPTATGMTKFDEAQAALREVLRLVPWGTKLSLWTFSQLPPDTLFLPDGRADANSVSGLMNMREEPELTINSDILPMAPWDPAQADAIIDKVGRLHPYFETPLVQAMWVAANRDLKNAKGLKTLLVLTDGNDNQLEKFKPKYNPNNSSVKDFIIGGFKPLGITVNMVFFTTKPESQEVQDAQKRFGPALAQLEPRGSFKTAKDLDELIAALRRGLIQKLTCRVLKPPDWTPIANDALAVTGPDEEEPWTSDLEPGLYNVRVQADRTYETVLDLRPGERCAVRLSSTDDGGIGFDLHQLVLSSTPTEPRYVPSSRIPLRTLPGRQAFFVFLKNSSPNAQTLIAEVLAGKNLVGNSPPIFVPRGGVTVAVPGFGTPAPKPDEPLAQAPQGLSLRLRDPGTDQVLDEQPLQPTIADPLEYLEVVRSQFIPGRPREHNRLEITLRSLPQMTGPPCPIRLDIPSDPGLFPAFLEPPRGNLEGLLEPGGKTLTLFAEDIKLKPSSSDQGQFSLSVDGIASALWYQTRFVPEGQAQKVEPVWQSRIRFRPEYTVKPDKPARLTVHFRVDNAPRDARLLFRLGHFERGEFKDDVKPWREQAQRRHIGFDPRGTGGALLFEASLGDWSKFDVPGIRGRRQLRAFLIDERGQDVLTTQAEDLILDDRPPGELAIDVPAEVEEGAGALLTSATVKPSAYLGLIPDPTKGFLDTGAWLAGAHYRSPAGKAGIKGNDILRWFNGREIRTWEDYKSALAQCRPGQTVEVSVARAGNLIPFRITLGAGKED